MAGFKIVAILKKRALKTIVEYCYVPSQWEENEILYWPKSGCVNLRNDPESVPEINTWLSYKCKVKKRDIMGLEEAQLWEEEYVGATITEAEESLTIPKKHIQSAYSASQSPTASNKTDVVMSTNNNTIFDNLFNNVVGNQHSNSTLTFVNQNGNLVSVDMAEPSNSETIQAIQLVEDVQPPVTPSYMQNNNENFNSILTEIRNEIMASMY